jgi:uncharacterized protein YndB with AHSA1/START domain
MKDFEERDDMTTSMIHHATFTIERSYSASPERVFAAFSDPAKKRRWFAGEAVDSFEMDFRVGGHEQTRRRTPIDSPMKGAPLTNETVFQDIVPDKRIVLAYTMAVGDMRISASLATFELNPQDTGTQLVFTEQAVFFEYSDGPVIREAGWRQLLMQLATEVTD